jgi:hypothetical protein
MMRVVTPITNGIAAITAKVIVKPNADFTIGKKRKPQKLPRRSIPWIQPTADPRMAVGNDKAP